MPPQTISTIRNVAGPLVATPLSGPVLFADDFFHADSEEVFIPSSQNTQDIEWILGEADGDPVPTVNETVSGINVRAGVWHVSMILYGFADGTFPVPDTPDYDGAVSMFIIGQVNEGSGGSSASTEHREHWYEQTPNWPQVSAAVTDFVVVPENGRISVQLSNFNPTLDAGFFVCLSGHWVGEEE